MFNESMRVFQAAQRILRLPQYLARNCPVAARPNLHLYVAHLYLFAVTGAYLTTTIRGSEAIPFATTSSLLRPSSWRAGTSKWVETSSSEATAMLL